MYFMLNPTLTPSHVLIDDAIWQRDRLLNLRGRAQAGDTITLRFRGERWRTTADATGDWMLRVDRLDAGGPDDAVIEIGSQRIIARRVLVGDVWVCSGQSNMAMPLADVEGGPEAIEAASREASDGPLQRLRLLRVTRAVKASPADELPPGSIWTATTAATAASFSAIGFMYGAALCRQTNVPIGLIDASVGNTPGEAWMPIAALESEPAFSPILERWQRSLRTWPDPGKEYEAAFTKWDRDADTAERAGRPIPGAHPKLIGPDHPWTPAGLWNAMIAPLTAAPIRGVLWSQGAAAPERAYQYRTLFRRLIRTWRSAWGVGDFPFYFVQEAAFGPRRSDPCEHSWAELREAQAMALTEPHTAMAVAIDCGEEKDIHPRRKAPVADRLARAALANVYGRNVPWSGPLLRSARVEGSTMRLAFDHANGGLATADGGPVRGLSITAGAEDFSHGNRSFIWAQSRIEGHDLVVWHPSIKLPVAVRYGWAQNPDCNLINAAGLPASPFRTDGYPGVTMDNR